MREIDIQQAAEVVAQGATLIDVRERDEFAAGHVPGAVNIPMGQLPSQLDQLDRTAPIHVICQSGGRSAAMVDVLTHAGFDAVNVNGGTSAWIRDGRPVEKV